MSSKLILMRHSLPDINPELPSHHWKLSDEGQRRCEPLAESLAKYHLDKIFTSIEPKANETGQILSQLLNRPFQIADGLHEHERDNVEFFKSTRGFEAVIAEFFARPNELVFGRETADQAHQRFSTAIDALTERHKDNDLAVVTHGTVMTLFVSRITGVKPFTFWQCLDLPSFAALTLPNLELIEVVESVS